MSGFDRDRLVDQVHVAPEQPTLRRSSPRDVPHSAWFTCGIRFEEFLTTERMATTRDDPRAKIPAGSPQWNHTWRLKDIPQKLREQMPDDYWKMIIKGGTDSPYEDCELMRESYWESQDLQDQLDATPLANVTHWQFERLMERVLWRVLVRAAKTLGGYVLVIFIGLMTYAYILRPIYSFFSHK